MAPPVSPDEQRRKSNRLAFWILGGGIGCGCLWFVFAFGTGIAVGVYNGLKQQEAIRQALESPTPDSDEHELRFSE